MQLDKLKQVAIDKIIKCLKEDETNMAAAVAKQLLKVDPENAQGLQLYSATLFGMNKFSEGIEVANKAILLDPSNAENHNNIALCYSHSGDFEKAIREDNDAYLKTLNTLVTDGMSGVIHRLIHDLDLVKARQGKVFEMLLGGSDKLGLKSIVLNNFSSPPLYIVY